MHGKLKRLSHPSEDIAARCATGVTLVNGRSQGGELGFEFALLAL
jgi:hypothetical protein